MEQIFISNFPKKCMSVQANKGGCWLIRVQANKGGEVTHFVVHLRYWPQALMC
jgi:hypothetical protein